MTKRTMDLVQKDYASKCLDLGNLKFKNEILLDVNCKNLADIKANDGQISRLIKDLFDLSKEAQAITKNQEDALKSAKEHGIDGTVEGFTGLDNPGYLINGEVKQFDTHNR